MGVDCSPSLITRAKRSRIAGAEFLVADAADVARHFAPQSMDGAVCLLAIQNMEKMDAVFHATAQVLKIRAPFILVLNHPCFRQPRQSGWGWDDPRKIQYRRLDRYLTSYEMPIFAHPGSAPNVKTFSYHRPLSAYVHALVAAGFVVDAMEEWVSPKRSDSGPRAKAENAARSEFPLFLALRAQLAS